MNSRNSPNGSMQPVSYSIASYTLVILPLSLVDKDGMTALMMACSMPAAKDSIASGIVKQLFKTECCEINQKEKASGKSALMLAAYNGLTETCRCLIKDCKANINIKDNASDVPFYMFVYIFM